jgi:itaconyl-CoA hydratase
VSRRIEQRGLYADELEVGDEFVHAPGRTLTEADNVLFTTLTMNQQALHLDHAFAAKQPFKRPLMNSMLTLSTLVGLSVAQLTQGTLVAQLGLSDIAFPHPVFAGDTLYASTTVTSKRASSSRPGQWIVGMSHSGTNQDGVVVARASRTVLMWDAPAHAAHRAGEVQA